MREFISSRCHSSLASQRTQTQSLASPRISAWSEPRKPILRKHEGKGHHLFSPDPSTAVFSMSVMDAALFLSFSAHPVNPFSALCQPSPPLNHLPWGSLPSSSWPSPPASLAIFPDYEYVLLLLASSHDTCPPQCVSHRPS